MCANAHTPLFALTNIITILWYGSEQMRAATFAKLYLTLIIRSNILGDNIMLWTIILILFILWALGIGFGGLGAGGGLVHLLLVVAVIVVILQLVRGRRA
jgi:Family of unknown function (DUF5670)